MFFNSIFKNYFFLKLNKLILYKNYNNKIFFFNFLNLNNNFNNYKNISKFKFFFVLFKNNQNLGFLIFNKLKKKKSFNFEKKKQLIHYKNIDMSKKFSLIFKKNRLFLNYLFNFKLLRNQQIKKKLKNFVKNKQKNIINYFNFKIIDILLISNFFSNLKDVLYFLKNNFIYLNNKIVNTNINTKKNNIINLNLKKSYFFFYKNSLKNINNLVSKFSKKFWLFNKYKKYFFKKKILKTRNWAVNLSSINFEILKFLEVDFLTLSVFILYKLNNIYFYNYFNMFFINLYLTRLYMWKLYI